MTFGELFPDIEDDNSDGEHLRDLLRAMREEGHRSMSIDASYMHKSKEEILCQSGLVPRVGRWA